MRKVGDRVPAARLQEFVEFEGDGCTLGPNTYEVSTLLAGKRIVIFALPGAFTPTCSAKHVPSYLAHAREFASAGVDEIWCVAVNDAFVMGAWARDQHTAGNIRMMADGSAEFSGAMGLTIDLGSRGMGTRSQRYSMCVDDGVIRAMNIDAPGKFEVSDALTLLGQIGAL